MDAGSVMDDREEVAKLEEACHLVWEEYERLMERMHTAANVEEIPIEELQRCTREVKAALGLYLFLKRREGKIRARVNTSEAALFDGHVNEHVPT